MALGALLNSLSSVTSSLSGISGAMSSLGGIASGIGGALGSAFSGAQEKATKAFTKIKEWFNDNLMPIWNDFKESMMPVWDFMVNSVMFWVNLFRGEWGKAQDNLIDNFESMVGLLSSIWNATIVPLWDGLRSAGGAAMEWLGGLWEDIMDGLHWAWDNTIGRAIRAISGAIDSIKNSWLGEKLGFGGGGGGGGGTTVGTQVSGGVSQTFNIKIDASGITDRSDKRALARESSRLVEEEMSRSMRGSSAIRHGR